MASKIFLDANVILEYFLKREKQNESRAIFLQIQEGLVRGFTTSSVVQACGYFLIKSVGKETTREILLNMLRYITIIDCGHETVVLALNSIISDPEDAIQYHSALVNNIEFYITFDEDLIKYSASHLPIMTPDKFLNS
ncbi:PIN domain-containing protein [Daejeonella sp. JGW-45]|uniref:type II toxin-antitoxin system VapC family toxin n=1 Tax=Daejeonella sp. JGW-45 TaxID=3034148 RepID=UPI0023EB97A1|nr:PIN domain-containing protein [Daejeonella sp. JGW-45]